MLMKLVVCQACNDVFKLGRNREAKYCDCGLCGGYYEEDGLNAVYWGEFAIPIGFNNRDLVEKIGNQPKKGNGLVFEAFVIPKECPTMQKILRQKSHPR
jgi:hypothetical protein